MTFLRHRGLGARRPGLLLALLLLPLLSGLAVSCRDAGKAEGTALLLSMELDASAPIDQVRISVTPIAGDVLGPSVAPDRAAGPLASPQSLRVLLPENLEGPTVVVTVEGLRNGVRVAQADAEATIRKGWEVEVELKLVRVTEGLEEPPPGPGPVVCNGIVCQDGQRCENNQCICDSTSCPTGCCNGNVCQDGKAAGACGAGGSACEQCPAGQACNNGVCDGCNADSCSDGCCSGSTCRENSVTSCGGNGSACVGCNPRVADNCRNGACACGSGRPCETGQQCLNGQCVCNQESCANGCCQGQTCTPRTLRTCGVKGSACSPCSRATSDQCNENGECRCGNGPACGEGLTCQDGRCQCTRATCQDGCCGVNAQGASVCLRGTSDNACGGGGGTCESCPPGQTCANGRCSGCNPSTCPDGCCSGSTCVRPTSAAACGAAGTTCAPCGVRGDRCDSNGTCSCGGEGACGSGQRCEGGRCICDPQTCNGCCNGNQCVRGTEQNLCGVNGLACSRCDATATDRCTDGNCRCGNGGACEAGQRCEGGQCVCNLSTCPDGCCVQGQCRRPPSPSICVGGTGTCSNCDPTKADRCDGANGCFCGANSACGAGQRCEGGQCVCNAASCASGCCNGNVCQGGATTDFCGKNGVSCQSCDLDRADQCSANGACSCGGGNACEGEQRCLPPLPGILDPILNPNPPNVCRTPRASEESSGGEPQTPPQQGENGEGDGGNGRGNGGQGQGQGQGGQGGGQGQGGQRRGGGQQGGGRGQQGGQGQPGQGRGGG